MEEAAVCCCDGAARGAAGEKAVLLDAHDRSAVAKRIGRIMVALILIIIALTLTLIG